MCKKMKKISRFTVTKLHGFKNVDLRFADNTLILVGENGAGKTTVLNLFYYLLSGQWSAMVRYTFEEVSITIDEKQFKLRYSDLGKALRNIDPHFLRQFPGALRRRIGNLLETNKIHMITAELEMISQEYGIPIQYLLQEMDLDRARTEKQTSPIKHLEAITESLDTQILFLPTYRRIEQELSLIFKGLDERELKQRSDLLASKRRSGIYVELIEFGMKDVEKAIDSTLSQLNTFARESLNNLTFGYLGDIVEEQYAKVDLNVINSASDQTISNVLNRIQDNILSPENKQHLRSIINNVKNKTVKNEHAMIICHYFTKLMSFQKELEKKESQITSFCEVCNEYMVDKTFLYDIAKFAFTISTSGNREAPREIKLSHLSSGEKQIVSLFSHLYLSGGSKYFVLIDEPELSLSVPWQRRFLVDIRNGDFCTGLVAVTHSPFIYDNKLQKYAHGLGEFIS
jgi:predicted ATP-dependent endonuclease of OLD family